MWFNSDLINAYRNSIAGQKDILMHVVNLPGLLGINHFWSKAIARTSCVPLWAVTKGKPWALRATEQTLKHILYYVYIHIHLYTYIHVLYYIYAFILSLFSHVWLFATHMDCSPPGSPVHGTLQARILEWVASPFSRGSSQSRDQSQFSCIAGRFFTIGPPGKSRGCSLEVLYMLNPDSKQRHIYVGPNITL